MVAAVREEGPLPEDRAAIAPFWLVLHVLSLCLVFPMYQVGDFMGIECMMMH